MNTRTYLLRNWHRRPLIWLGLGWLTLVSVAAPAAPSVIQTASTPHVEFTLAPEFEVASPGQTVPVILHQRLADGWHTYWTNPGDSGQPIGIDWHLPDGVMATGLAFPVPEPIRFGPLMNHGYSHETAVLGGFQIPADWPAGRPLEVAGKATWLVCADVCIPEESEFAFTLPTDTEPRRLAEMADAFAAARAALPRLAPWPVTVSRVGDRLTLTVALPEDQANAYREAFAEAWFFADAWGHLQHPAAQPVSWQDGRPRLSLTVGEVPPADRLTGLLRLGGDPATGHLVDAPIVAAAAAPSDPGTLALLLFAFVGGLLLNLMPCVFPVLAIKALALVSHAGESKADRAAGGAAYAAGVILSLLVLAAVLLAVKAGGTSVGWGFHLQDPAVVAALAMVLFAVGLNLSGLVDVGGAWTGLGSGLAARRGTVGSFFTGVLATVVAAPCTAPFMATAIGVALVNSGVVTVAVFTALGLGLAAPYVLLTLFPALSRLLPKPGAWMERLKQFLAFPMYASAVWLVWVLAQQTGPDAVALVLAAMVALALAAWAWRAGATSQGAGLLAGRAAAGLALAASVVSLAGAMTAPPATFENRVQTAGLAAEVYDPDRIVELQEHGQAVFLNVTAAWCVTCKVNERIALSGEAFQRALADRGVVYMKGDWTRRDPEITALLERFGRAGVPLYVLYPRDGSAPRLLPQVLTHTIVQAAFADA